jgi:cobalamin biosynthesis protein CbiD
MPNRNYIKGANYERHLIKKAESIGFFGMRSAGSHGAADITLIGHHGTVMICQCRAFKMSPKEFEEAVKKLNMLRNQIGEYKNIEYYIVQRINHKDVWTRIETKDEAYWS